MTSSGFVSNSFLGLRFLLTKKILKDCFSQKADYKRLFMTNFLKFIIPVHHIIFIIIKPKMGNLQWCRTSPKKLKSKVVFELNRWLNNLMLWMSWRDRFVFVGWYVLLFPCAYYALGGWFTGTTFSTSWYTHELTSCYL